MSLRELPWHERGRLAYVEGKSTDDAPYPANTDEGQAWLEGWNEAADEDGQDESLESVGVCLKQYNGRLVLVDSRGRMIGSQMGVVLEQKDDQSVAHVSFFGVVLK